MRGESRKFRKPEAFTVQGVFKPTETKPFEFAIQRKPIFYLNFRVTRPSRSGRRAKRRRVTRSRRSGYSKKDRLYQEIKKGYGNPSINTLRELLPF